MRILTLLFFCLSAYAGDHWTIHEVKYGFDPDVPQTLRIACHGAAAEWNTVMPDTMVFTPADSVGDLQIHYRSLGNTTALAVTGRAVESGVITSAGMVFNSDSWGAGVYDGYELGTAVHEFGHAVGLQHCEITVPGDPETMFHVIFPGQSDTLHIRDLDAARALYGLDPSTRSLTIRLGREKGHKVLDAGTDQYAIWTDSRGSRNCEKYILRATAKPKTVHVLWNGMTASVKVWKKRGMVFVGAESQ